jgi:hypothetical protein
MNAIVLTTLITAVATVSGSLGAVWIKSHYDEQAQARQARETADENAIGRQRDAYAGLLQTARFVHGVALRLREEFEGLPSDDIDHLADRAEPLIHDLTQAVALVELIGSGDAPSQARTIYYAAMEVGRFYSESARARTAARNNNPENPGPDFDKDGASDKLRALSAAMESFTKCVRPKLERTPSDQRSASRDATTGSPVTSMSMPEASMST